MNVKIIIAIISALFIFNSSALQAVQGSDHIKISAYSDKTEVKAGDEIMVKMVITMDDYWYTYGMVEIIGEEGIGPMPSEITMQPADVFELPTHVFAQKPYIKYDEGFEFDIEIYKTKYEFYVPVKIKKDANLAEIGAKAVFFVQLCDTIRCLPGEEYSGLISAETITFSESDIADFVKVNATYSEDGFPSYAYDESVDRDFERADKKTPEKAQTESSEIIDQKKKEGIFSYIWFSMLMGAVSLLTPCVFPMIPITVSFFTKRAEKSKGTGLRDSLVYSLGIILTFTMIGFMVSIFFGPTGISQLATNGWVNLAIAAIFVIFALNLFGAFEIQIPPSLLNLLNKKSTGDGIGSVLMMGLVFSLTSFTCTVPFVGSSLISVSSGEWFYPILGMLGFSAVFAAPFFLLALFPSFMTKLPKSGGWMNNVKVVMGFVEIAAAIKFFSNADLFWSFELIPKDVFISIWLICGVLIVAYILGWYRLPHDSQVDSVGSVRIIFALVFGTITIWLGTGLLGKPLGELDAFLPPKEYGVNAAAFSMSGVSSSNVEEYWFKDYDLAIAKAKEEDKPLFIDFTGWQCTNCRWMETNMFPRAPIHSLMQNMIKVKLYTDSRNPTDLANREMQRETFGSIELPLYVILSPDEKMIASKGFTRDETEFIEFLKKASN